MQALESLPDCFCVISTTRWDPPSGSLRSGFYLLPYNHARLFEAATFFNFPVPPSLGSQASFETWRTAQLDTHQSISPSPTPESLRIRVALDSQKSVSATFTPAPRLPEPSYVPTSISSLLPHPPSSASSSQPALTPTDSSNPPSLQATGVPQTWNIYMHPSSPASMVAPSALRHFKTNARAHYGRARTACIPPHFAPSPTARMQEVILLDERAFVAEGSLSTPYFFHEGRWITPRCAGGPGWRGGLQGITRRVALEEGLAVEGDFRGTDVRDGEVVVLSNGVRRFGWGVVRVASSGAA